jgi:hypothetical protein
MSAICGVPVFVLMGDVVIGKIKGKGGTSVITCHTEHGQGRTLAPCIVKERKLLMKVHCMLYISLGKCDGKAEYSW